MRIAIVKLSSLGDIVHSMIVLQFIKNFNKEILVDWVVEESFKDLIEFHPDVNKLHTVNLKKVKKKKSILILIKELNKLRNLGPFDLVIDMQGLVKSALISWLIPSKKTIGFDKESLRESYAAVFYSEKYNLNYSKNIIFRNTSLIESALGLTITKKQIFNKDSFLFSKNKKSEIELSSLKKNIILIPGASIKSKCYPPDKFIEITNAIDANFFITWGSIEEKMLANIIESSSNNAVVCSKKSIDELIFFISKSDLVIGSDTGPTHIAWALNIPSITLFGSTPGYRNTLETKINKIIESDSEVDPFKINQNDFSIKNIKSKDVVKMAKLLLKK